MTKMPYSKWTGLTALVIFPLLSTVRADEPFVPTKVAEIDAMRRDFATNPTTPENASRRHSLIFSWVRLLVHRGVNMEDFHDACAKFSAWGPIKPSRYQAMQEAYDALEKIQANPSFYSDFLPTLCELTGAKLPEQTIHGRSFSSQLFGKPGNPREWIHRQNSEDRQVRNNDYILNNKDQLRRVVELWEDPAKADENRNPEKEAAARKVLQSVFDTLGK